MDEQRGQGIALEKTPLRVRGLPCFESRVPHAIFGAGVAGIRQRAQRDAAGGGGRCRLVGLRGLARQAGQRQPGCRIELPGFRHPVDGLVGWFLRRHGRVLLLLPLETAVPWRKLRGRQRHDLVEIGDFGVAAVVGTQKLVNLAIPARALRVALDTEIIKFIGGRRTFKSVFQEGSGLRVACLRSLLKSFYGIGVELPRFLVDAQQARRLAESLIGRTCQHLSCNVGSLVIRQQQISNVELCFGVAKIRRLAEVMQCGFGVRFQAVARFKIVTHVVVAAGNALLHQLHGEIACFRRRIG